VTLDVDPAARLLDTLRYQLALTGHERGLRRGRVAAPCTVYLDGFAGELLSRPTYQVRGHRVETVESLIRPPSSRSSGAAATQCGALHSARS